MKSIKKRTLSFWKSDSPLTSRRVSILLSNSHDSNSLADTIRKGRHIESNASFKISDESQREIQREIQLEG